MNPRRESLAAGLAVIATWLAVSGLNAQSAQRVTYDLTAMYEAVNPSIAKIHSDFGTGSGFLVRQDGLIATNHHVVKNSRYLAAEFPNGRKVTADIVLLDAKHDLAILKVNRSVVAALKSLTLSSAEKDTAIKAGIPAVAFGSPLSQTFMVTQGIVSKVEEYVLLGDFLIQPGNSGGPLLNLDAEVIGVNTFTAGRTSGAVRVSVLRDSLASPQVSAKLLTEPSAEQLPLPGPAYSTDLLKEKVLTESFDVRDYRLDGGKFMITAYTPVLWAKASVQDDLRQAANRYSRRGKKIKDERYDPVDEPFYDWVRNADKHLASVVTIQIQPDYGQTAGSIWTAVAAGMAAGLNGTTAAPVRATYEYKAEFLDFKLYRDGQLIRPITPGRAITSQSVDTSYLSFVDEAYSGMYTYSPDVFLKGSEWTLEVYDAREAERVHRRIVLTPSSKLIAQIRQDFAGAGGDASPIRSLVAGAPETPQGQGPNPRCALQCGSVRLNVGPSTATLYVNGWPLGTVSQIGGDLKLRPGTHVLELRADGYESKSTTIVVKENWTTTARLSLARK